MPDSVILKIKELQELLPEVSEEIVPEHNPEMLLIGCVDARLDPTSDIGIPYGKALIKRNIAALVPPQSDGFISIDASLEFAVKKKQVRHIVVMGHTHCGGVEACLDGVEDPAIEKYLAPLNVARKRVIDEGGSKEEQARSMEREAVRQSIENLKTYPVVKDALEKNELKLHGWVIATGTKRLSVLNQDTGKFSPMSEKDSKKA